MKERIKVWIFSGFVFLAILICILAINTYINAVSDIKLYSNYDLEYLEEYEEELKKLEINDCTNEIRKWIDYYKNTSYKYVKITEFNEKFLFSFTPGSKNSSICIDAAAVVKKHSEKFIVVDKLWLVGAYRKYMFQYSIGFNFIFDSYYYDEDADFLVEEYELFRNTILNIIDDMIKYEKQRMVVDVVE